ncbi:MAG: glycosyltransferase family 61 protein, partial [Verrucomicrobiota bacterium]
MKQLAIRRKMFAKRKIVQVFGYGPNKTVSLERQESLCNVSYERICEYSKSFGIEIEDPRSDSLRGHYFQNRTAYLLKNVILEPKQGLVYSATGELIAESTIWPPSHVYSSFPWNPGKNLKRLHIKSGILITSNAFWHWLVEDLASTIFSLQVDSNSPVLVAKNPPKYVLDFLETVDREIIFLDEPVQVDSLILVGKAQDSGWPHPKDLDVLSKYDPFVRVIQRGSLEKKIYISRRASRRSPKNEEAIEKIFLSHNFEIMRLEDLNLLEEIRIVSGVTFLAGVHGAGLVNLIWMPRESKTLDIVNENYWTESIHRAAFLSGVKY